MLGPQQLAFVRTQVLGKVPPIYTEFVKANASAFGIKAPVVGGPPSSGVIECGSYSVPDYGCSDSSRDSETAYTQALLWAITGDPVYAQNAGNIVDLYVAGVKSYNNTNAPLQAGWDACKWTRVVEILSHTGAPWSSDASARATRWLYSVHLPLIWAGSGSNGNWELVMLQAMFGMAVLAENATVWNRATGFWAQRVPAYLYLSEIDGSAPYYAPRKSGSFTWNGQTVFNASFDGICQETCRDMGHTGMGIDAMVGSAETAWAQGIDLYAMHQNRIRIGLEYNAYFATFSGAFGTQPGALYVYVPCLTPLLLSASFPYNATLGTEIIDPGIALLCGGNGVVWTQTAWGEIVRAWGRIHMRQS